MSQFEASTALDQASRLSASARRAGRWYAKYLLIYAVATFTMCLLFGVIGGKWAAIILSPVWVLLVVLLSVWANRQRYVIAGMTRVHLFVIGLWACAWVITVVLGTTVIDTFAWWLLGGVITALPPLVGALVVSRRTR